ncbi:MAG: Mrp/NBP35 family ATP-binding protein [Peptococcaceae bacterium]|nr:Mrp/NBP35 family ATP-binding protein [Peptococcaceae bacterium]
MISEAEIREALRDVMDPEIHQSIIDLDMVRTIQIDGNTVTVDIALTIAGCPLQNEIKASVEAKLKSLPEVQAVRVKLGVMAEEERRQLTERLHGPKAAAKSPIMDPNSPTRIIIVASGKGGVGKSTVTVNLAVALSRLGKHVGILDADIYGFSIPRMIGASGAPTVLGEDTILPLEAHGVKLISMGSFVSEDTPVVWRGPMLIKALEQFLTDVLWGELDYLLIDSPPGTGDIALSAMQMLPKAKVLIVTTPQASAFKVASRVGHMAQKVQMPVLGVVENMSYFVCDSCLQEHHIFGEGGGEQVATALGTQLLARIPLGADVREKGDTGEPIAVQAPEAPAGKAFNDLALDIDRSW